MQLFKLCVSFCVVGFLIRKIMKTSVKLDNNPCTCDIEVNDEITDILLSVDGHGQPFEKIVPKMLFFGSHPFSECLCRTDKFFAIVVYHGKGIGFCLAAEKRQKSSILSVYTVL